MDSPTLNLLLGILIGSVSVSIIWAVFTYCHRRSTTNLIRRYKNEAGEDCYRYDGWNNDQSEFRFYWPAT